MRTRRLLVAALCGAFFATTAAAQGCPTGTFWKRDTLPDVPTGLTGVSVIQGMCEGESAGVVFEMPANMPPQRITQVVAPWGAGLGVNGFQALLDVEVYDGVSFSGAFANMGTRVFSLTQAGAAEMNVQSHGLNTLDTSTFNIIVGNAPATGTPPVRRFAICFRTNLNLHPSGSCASGWPANFFTDNAQQPGLFCNNTITPQRTSLIEISEDAYPAFYTTFGNGCPNSLGVSHLIPATLPRLGQNLFVIVDNLPFNLGLMITGASNSFSTLGPLPIDMTPIGLPGCNLRVSLDFMTTLVGGGSSASYLLPIPNSAQLLGAQLFQQPFAFDPPLNAFGGSLGDAATMQIGS